MFVHYFSDRAEPFQSTLPLLIKAAGAEEEHVWMVEAPLSELVDRTIWINRHPDFPDRAVVDAGQREFFQAIRASLLEAVAKIDLIEFATLDDEDDDA